MLPVLVLLFLGAFYLRELTATRIRANEAARYVAWENVWYVREKNTRKAAQFVTELKDLGLAGTRLKNVTILKRSLNTYMSQVTAPPFQFFIPQAFADPFNGIIGGQGENDGFVSGLSNQFAGIMNTFGAVPVAVQDAFGGMTNWDTADRPEVSQGVYTAMVTYDFKPSGPFFRIPPIQIRGFSSLLSHPFAVVRSDDKTEFTRVFGSPDDVADTSGHITPLWLFPAPPPSVSGAFGPASGFLSTLGGILDIVKKMIVGVGGLLNKIPSLGSPPGFKLPSGTLKEFPEFHQKRQPAGNTSSNAGNRLGR